mmetsp:Transcript_53287/g.169298  ORF Transcript_53287/g.169298 Transcript_53287/m.169298 type:complete len:233 (+) Transcript_53287:320-1018(+)
MGDHQQAHPLAAEVLLHPLVLLRHAAGEASLLGGRAEQDVVPEGHHLMQRLDRAGEGLEVGEEAGLADDLADGGAEGRREVVLHLVVLAVEHQHGVGLRVHRVDLAPPLLERVVEVHESVVEVDEHDGLAQAGQCGLLVAALLVARQHLRHAAPVLLRPLGEAELLVHPEAATAAHLAAQRHVAEALEGLLERVGVAGGDEDALSPRVERLGDAVDVGGDDGALEGHGLADD